MKKDLILLPGLDGTGVLFDDMVKYLEGKFRVIRVSYPPAQRCSLEDLSEVVKEKILYPQNSIIIAESFSGLVALTLLQKQEIHPKGIIFGMCFAKPPLLTILRVVTKLSINNVSWEGIPDLIYRSLCLGHSAKRAQIENLRTIFLEKGSRSPFPSAVTR